MADLLGRRHRELLFPVERILGFEPKEDPQKEPKESAQNQSPPTIDNRPLYQVLHWRSRLHKNPYDLQTFLNLTRDLTDLGHHQLAWEYFPPAFELLSLAPASAATLSPSVGSSPPPLASDTPTMNMTAAAGIMKRFFCHQDRPSCRWRCIAAYGP